MITNIAGTAKKAATHSVRKIDTITFEVASGSSGSKYIVVLSKKPSCTCRWGQMRKNGAGCGCSHVQSAVQFASSQMGYKATARHQTDDVSRLKRRTAIVGDGVQFTLRRVSA